VLLCHLKPVPLYSTVQYRHTIHKVGSGVLMLT
jgi:hypothetical protein